MRTRAVCRPEVPQFLLPHSSGEISVAQLGLGVCACSDKIRPWGWSHPGLPWLPRPCLTERGSMGGWSDARIRGVWKLSTPSWPVKQCSRVPHRATAVVVTNLGSRKLGSHRGRAALVSRVVIK